MLLVLIIILILIWAAVVWSIYSNFLVFYSNFSETENYHKAYYTSISALERWELVVKQRLPWYQWYGWRYRSWATSSNLSTWSYHNWDSDWVISSNFSYLSNNWEPSKVIRSVDSRTTKVPKTTWNVEFTLRSSDSYNYNAMDYENGEIFLLYYDKSDGSPYKKAVCPVDSSSTDCVWTKLTSISWKIRLPKHLVDSWGFTVLDTWMALIWVSNELPGDDTIVDRQIRWTYDNYPYTIFSTQKVHSGGKVEYSKDSIFRESDLNNSSDHSIDFSFWGGRNTIQWIHGEWTLSRSQSSVPATIISQRESVLNGVGFQWLFNNTYTKKNQIRFSLLNLVKDKNWKIYPFLEYKINFNVNWWSGVSDKYFTIKWEWAFSDFEVNTIVQKPTVKDTVLWDFTSIF